VRQSGQSALPQDLQIPMAGADRWVKQFMRSGFEAPSGLAKKSFRSLFQPGAIFHGFGGVLAEF
jgi:hypothetical protein